MKKTLFALFALIALGTTFDAVAVANSTAATSSEVVGRHYTVTGNRVILRSGPGKNYRQVHTMAGPVYFYKGDWVFPTGKAKNGYMPIVAGLEGHGDVSGWISVQYIR